MIEAIGVIVPAHDEEELLPACVDALDRALAAVPPTVARTSVIMLDACRDGSAACCGGIATLACEFRNAGAARALGARHVLDYLRSDPAKTWLATTDADSRVPSDWLVTQLALAARGAQAVAGTVVVDDWTEHPSGLAERFVRFYEANSHVHGANLGVRADAYLAVGGFEALESGEDHALWHALADRPRMTTREIPVITSARRRGRAPAGFADFLIAFAG